MSHENALVRGLISRLGADPAVTALLGDPPRVWDEPPAEAVTPWLRIGRGESRPVPADGGGMEHRLSLGCVSRFGGAEEARAVCAAVRAALDDAEVVADGVRAVSLRTTFTDVFRSGDGRRTYGVIRLACISPFLTPTNRLNSAAGALRLATIVASG